MGCCSEKSTKKKKNIKRKTDARIPTEPKGIIDLEITDFKPTEKKKDNFIPTENKKDNFIPTE